MALIARVVCSIIYGDGVWCMESADIVACTSEMREESKSVIGGGKKGVACYWLPSGKCMLSPVTKKTHG